MIPVGQPYRAAGPISIRSVLTTLILGTVTALLCAAIVWAWELSPIPTLVIITPLIQGFLIGTVLSFMIGRLRMRNPRMMFLIGLTCGLASVLMVHYGHYLHNVDEIVASIDKEIQADGDLTPDEKTTSIAEVKRDPRAAANLIFLAQTGHTGFLGSMMLRSQAGMMIKSIELTGIGVWILWGVEALMVAAVAATLAHSRAVKPFCEDCETWCEEALSPIILPGHAASPLAEAIQIDSPAQTYALLEQPSGELSTARTRANLIYCPSCEQTFIDVVLKTDQVKKGKTETVTTEMIKQMRISPEMASLFKEIPPAPEPIPEPVPES